MRNGNESIRKVAERFKIPRTTLQDHLNNVWMTRVQVIERVSHIGAGQLKEINEEMEKYLVHGIQYLGSIGWLLEVGDISKVIKLFLDNARMNKRFKDNIPEKDWVRSFLKRHKSEISKRKPEYVTTACVKGLTSQVLTSFFVLVENFQAKLEMELDGSKFYNLDETGLSLDPKMKNCLFKKGSDAMCITSSKGKSMYTVLFCGNACGEYLPPYVIFKGKGCNFSASWIAGAPEGMAFNVTPSGWMEGFALDVGVFGPAKKSWQSIL